MADTNIIQTQTLAANNKRIMTIYYPLIKKHNHKHVYGIKQLEQLPIFYFYFTIERYKTNTLTL